MRSAGAWVSAHHRCPTCDDTRDGHRWGLVLAFDTDDPEFTRGVEAGIIWAHLETYRCHEGIVSNANAEMVIRMAEARGMPFHAEELGDEWLYVTIGTPP